LKSYVNGTTTRNRIIEACKDLFCEKGYKKTTYSDICESAQVNSGTISHHFKSKKNLASLLYYKIIADFYKSSEELFPHEDSLQQVMIAFGMHMKLLFKNSVYRRFSSEFLNEGIEFDELDKHREHTLKAHEVMQKRIGPQRTAFLSVALEGINRNMELYINKHIDEFTYEQVYGYIARIYYHFVDSGELDVRIDKALKSLALVNISFDHFDVSVQGSQRLDTAQHL